MFEFTQMKRVFKDSKHQEEFEKNGFIVVDFYSPAEIEEVKALYRNLHPKDEKGFFPSAYSKDKKYRETTDKELQRIGSKKFEELLVDYQIINGCFIVKSPGQESYLHVHQDMTLVDESEFTGMNIWTTTVDLNDENGVLYLLLGSHRFFPTYRGHTLPGFYDPIQEEIKDYMTPYYLKAGQAIIFDQSIVHFSPPNTSDEVRIVSNVYFTHKDARFQICYHDKNDPVFNGKVELFEQDLSFMTNYEQFGENIYNRPKMGKSLGLVDYNFPSLSIEELENKFNKHRIREYTPTKQITENSIQEAEPSIQKKPRFFKIYTPSNVFKEIINRLF
jgi:ectoine hydroxylase-related dioxygenase (phytanoyl-CoA dioxygenase family)